MFKTSFFEIDSLQVISALNSSSANLSAIRPIIEDAKIFMHMTAEVSADHVRQHANSVAHRIASRHGSF
ncbi:hypothetical protein ACFX15_036511 [Malus domestica]